MKLFLYNDRQFNVVRDSCGMVLVAPGRLRGFDDYQPVDVLSDGLRSAALARLTAKRPSNAVRAVSSE